MYYKKGVNILKIQKALKDIKIMNTPYHLPSKNGQLSKAAVYKWLQIFLKIINKKIISKKFFKKIRKYVFTANKNINQHKIYYIFPYELGQINKKVILLYGPEAKMIFSKGD